MKEVEHERRDWMVVFVILLFGLLCVFLASGWALRFAPTWKLNTSMGSDLDPNGNYLTRPSGFVEAIDSDIQTPPVWMGFFLTEGAIVPTRVWTTSTPAPLPTSTHAFPSATKYSTGTPTNTLVYVPFTATSTSNPAFTRTPTPKVPLTSTATGTATKVPTATRTATATATSTNTPTATATATIIPPLADLGVTITDNAVAYSPNSAIQYTIQVFNSPASPSGVTGASLTGSFSANLDPASATWTCTSGASGNGDINITVNLPVGSSITCTVNATAIASPSGDLVSSVVINPPAGITDSNPGNNTDTDTDQLVIAYPFPYGNIDLDKNGTIEFIPANTTITLQFGTPLVVGSHAGYDLIYYELPQGSATTTPGVQMDCVILQIGDGVNWYTIFNWGDNTVDANASMNMNTLGVTTENDNLAVDASAMYNSTGIEIDVDGSLPYGAIPPGTYKYIRIISPGTPPDSGDGVEIDAIHVIP